MDPTQKALDLIYKCISEEGIFASTSNVDNYKRVWSRDAMLTGITGIIYNDKKIIEGLYSSIQLLKKHQSIHGQIPSNVSIGEKPIVSFGSLAGRVDATTWWIIGACAYLKSNYDISLKHELEPAIDRAFEVLNAWEFNQRGLMYTPLGGNWADEYICEGYVLYDQLLRLWALRLFANVYNRSDRKLEAEQLTSLIQENYFYHPDYNGKKYHPTAYTKAASKTTAHYWFQLNANGYDTRWDMAANALVLMLNLHPDPLSLEAYVSSLAGELNHWMIPAFYPVIKETDPEWHLLSQNYSYRFKNIPFNFHNGGSWPIFMGLLGLGFANNNLLNVPNKMLQALDYQLASEEPSYSFHEYWSTDKLEAKGTNPLCFTMSGYLLLQYSTSGSFENLKKLLP